MIDKVEVGEVYLYPKNQTREWVVEIVTPNLVGLAYTEYLRRTTGDQVFHPHFVRKKDFINEATLVPKEKPEPAKGKNKPAVSNDATA